MQRVVTINLNGNAYQLDEAAFGVLRAYLDQAEARLKDNPDRAEILADLEQAIAEKCRRFLGPHKTVVTAAEMDEVVKEMGPVEGAESTTGGATSETSGARPDEGARTGPRRLYRIREGGMWAGVCNGIAAYFHVDVVLVRIGFVALVVLSFGWAWLGYWVLACIIPVARTGDERAAAYGQPPFNAQDLIDEAKRAAATFKQSAKSSRREWRRQMQAQRRQWRTQSRAWRWHWPGAAGDPRRWPPGAAAAPMDPMPAWAGLLLPLLSLASLALFVAMMVSILSLVNTGAIYGWPLPAGMPMWAGILILVILFQFVTSPIRAARRASRYAWGPHFAWFAVWDGMFVMSLTVFGFWLIFRHMPPVEDFPQFIQHLPGAISGAAVEVSMWFRSFFEKL